MLKKGKGTILLTGATASLRGSAKFGGFAASKFALRALGQSMARELGPKGIHVAHIIIDGEINTPQQVQGKNNRFSLFPDNECSFFSVDSGQPGRDIESFLNSDAVREIFTGTKQKKIASSLCLDR